MALKSIKFPDDSVPYLTLDWNDMAELSFKLALKLSREKMKIDRIITLAKGGWAMSRALSDFLQVSEISSIGLRTYAGINERLPKPIIYQDLSALIKGENILLFDDVVDTGASIDFLKNILKKRGAKKIITAAIFYKPHSKIAADYYSQKTSDWIIFPYEIVETAILLRKRWKKMGMSSQDISLRFEKFPFYPYLKAFSLV